MASISEKTTKNGTKYYEIRCHVDRNRPTLTTRWYPPEGWSRKSIQKELQRFAADFERRCKAGEVLSRAEQLEREEAAKREAASILTLRQFAEQVYLPAKAITCSGNSMSSFRGNLTNYVYPALGDCKMTEITSAQLNALLIGFQATGRAHGTVVKLYTVLKSLFKMAYMNDLMDRNPMDKVERPKPRKDEVKQEGVEAYTAADVWRILDCLSREPLKWQVLVRLLVDTGIRRGECCGLQWENIDFDRCIIRIQHNLCYTPERGVYVDTPKNGKHRTVDVDQDILRLLTELKREQDAGCPSPWVFTQESNHKPMHPQSPTRYMKKFSARYGIPDLHPHKLRHSFASIAITNGADIASVSEKLGHSDKAVTLRMYTHSNPERMRQASEIFRSALHASARNQGAE